MTESQIQSALAVCLILGFALKDWLSRPDAKTIQARANDSRKYPERVGLIDDRLFGQERWYHPMFYPVFQSKRAHSALRFGGEIDAPPDAQPPKTAP